MKTFMNYQLFARQHLQGLHLWIVLLFLVVLGGIAAQVWAPQYIRWFVDSSIGQKSQDHLVTLALGYLGVVVLRQVLQLVGTYLGEKIGWIATNRLRRHLTQHCLSLKGDFYQNHSIGELLERLDGDVQMLANFFARFVLEVVGNVLFLVSVIVLLSSINGQIGAIFAGFVVVSFILFYQSRLWTRSRWIKARQCAGLLYGFVGEALDHASAVHPMGATGFVMRRLDALLQKLLLTRRHALMGSSLVWCLPVVVFALGDGLAFVILGRLHHQGEITVGTAYTVFFYLALLVQPMDRLKGQMQGFQQIEACLQRAQDLLAEPTENPGGTETLSGAPWDLQLRGVQHVHTTQQTPTLQDISLHIPAGSSVALVGRTGSGKSTLVRLLTRQLEATSGQVLLNGQPIQAYALGALREQLAWVTQEVQVLHATLRENITLFCPEASDDSIVAAMHTLGLSHWYQRQPHGLDTVLDTSALSAGETQLLACVRALVKQASMLVLDEPTAQVDAEAELRVERALVAMKPGRTLVVVTHRPGLLKHVDQVVVVEQGSIVEQGVPAELLKEPTSHLSRLNQMWIEGTL